MGARWGSVNGQRVREIEIEPRDPVVIRSQMAEEAPLTRVEKLALRFAELANEDRRGKWLQTRFLRGVSYVWVRAALAQPDVRRGLDDLMRADRPDTGVMLVSNHRSFFDQYAMLLACYMGPVPWSKRLYFPVRSNFFYDQPLGIAVNALVAGGAMYPPIYRQAERRALNDEALDKMVEILRTPGNVLGMHPEGTRGKGDDPYTFLPAQPGVGKLALIGKPVVIPAFILGLGNNIGRGHRVELHPRRAARPRRDHGVRPADRLRGSDGREAAPDALQEDRGPLHGGDQEARRAREGAARRARTPGRSPMTTRAG